MRTLLLLAFPLVTMLSACYSGPVAGERPPIAKLTGPAYGQVGVPVRFDASASLDPDGSIRIYAFQIGQGGPKLLQSAPIFYHTFDAPGTVEVSVIVIDRDELQSSATVSVTIGTEPSDVVLPSDVMSPDGESDLETLIPDIADRDGDADGMDPGDLLPSPDGDLTVPQTCQVHLVGSYDWAVICPNIASLPAITEFSVVPGVCTFQSTGGVLKVTTNGATIVATGVLISSLGFKSCKGEGTSTAFKIPCDDPECVLRVEKRN